MTASAHRNRRLAPASARETPHRSRAARAVSGDATDAFMLPLLSTKSPFYDLSVALARQLYDVSFEKLYDVNLAINTYDVKPAANKSSRDGSAEDSPQTSPNNRSEKGKRPTNESRDWSHRGP